MESVNFSEFNDNLQQIRQELKTHIGNKSEIRYSKVYKKYFNAH